MTDKEIEALAKKKTPLPDDATLADTLYYQNLLLLYREFRAGIIDKDQGKLMKSKLVSQYGVQKLWEKCGQNNHKRWKKYQTIQPKANKDGCPICKEIVRILDGRDD